MSKILPSSDLQSKSIYSDACQNFEEIEQIYRNSKKLKSNKDDKSPDNKKLDNSHVKLYSNNSINEKYSISEYKSCYEEKIKDENNIGDNVNIDMEIKILENLEKIKHMDLSTINSNNNFNNSNFLEENTEIGLNKVFEIDFDKKIYNSKNLEFIKFKKLDNQNNNIRNSNSLFENYRYENLNLNDSKNKLTKINQPFNSRKFSSFSTNNKYFFESKNNKNININFLNNIESKKELEIDKIKFEGIKKDEIDIEYFNSKFETILIKSKNINNQKHKHIKTLYEIQDFIADNSPITVIKIDDEGKYLASGFKSGIIKIFEIMNYSYDKFRLIYDKNNLKEYLHFINETPIKNLTSHSNEILDLFWLLSSNKFMLSSSINLVILWNFNQENKDIFIVKNYRYLHRISCISVNTNIQNMFGTGNSDKFVKLWTINKSILNDCTLSLQIKNNNEKMNDDDIIEFYVGEEIISLNFLPEGNKIIIGTNKGLILIYKIIPEINFEYKFDCKNRLGKPITDINFFSLSSCIISSLDSRIRFFNIKNGTIIHKYKGHKNEKNNIKTYIDSCNDIIITGSENGFCYLYNVFNKENNKIKNYSYEYFKPFPSNDTINIAQIICEKCYVNYFQKILKITNKIMLNSIIISGNDKGKIKIMLNIDESY